MYSYDEDNIAALIEDFTDTIEIESFSRQIQQRLERAWPEDDSGDDGAVLEVNDKVCCYYKYLHSLPHEHDVVSRAVQCGSGRLKQSNNHNKDLNSPPILRESQKFCKIEKEPLSVSLEDFKNFNSYVINDKSRTGSSRKMLIKSQISLEDTDNNPHQYIIEVASNNSTINKNGHNVNNCENEYSSEDKNISTRNDFSKKEKKRKKDRQKFQNLAKYNVKKRIERFSDNYQHIYLDTNKDPMNNLEMFENRNQVRGRYCAIRNVQHKFFLTENANIENIIQDSSDRRIKAVCDRYNCNIDIYSKVIRNGYRKNIIVISAPNDDFLGKCVRSLDHNMNWCLTCQLKH